jgi:3-deoxy-D-manno-octulosonate 8-phosphate phosphatase (KDO 8-P phosphatase)
MLSPMLDSESQILSRGHALRAPANGRPADAVGTADVDPALRGRFARVKLFLCDVDGVLTDASVFMGGGVEYKRFHIRDGLGLRMLQKCGVKVGWISARPSDATKQRADDLKIDYLIQSQDGKTGAAVKLLETTGLGWEDVCFMGDDLVDLGLLRRVGLAVAVPDGLAEARACAHYVTQAGGGHGAVREVAELILKAQGHWERLIAEFSA